MTSARRVLILGATSYVAQFICKRFLYEIDEATAKNVTVACTVRTQVTATTELPNGFIPASAPSASSRTQRTISVFGGVDITDEASLTACIDRFQPDIVINCIAMSSPAVCERNPTLATTINEPNHLISSISRQQKPIRLIHFSTDFVYSGTTPPRTGYKEEDAVLSADQCVYSASKLRFDQYLKRQHPSHLDAVVLRIANVVGPPAPLFHDQSPKFMEWLHRQLYLADSSCDGVRLWSDEIRSFIFVEDIARVVWKLVDQSPQEPSVEIFNLGGEEALSRVDIAERYCAFMASIMQTVEHRSIAPCARTSITMGYHAPLDATMDSSRLKGYLPGLQLTSSSDYLQEIGRCMLEKQLN
ncbi:hypothetical protein PINS_up003041 [Pythium insidiosum]|nr:hypothetical protein PINS_up003041 [Pythium insidiosum]